MGNLPWTSEGRYIFFTRERYSTFAGIRILDRPIIRLDTLTSQKKLASKLCHIFGPGTTDTDLVACLIGNWCEFTYL